MNKFTKTQVAAKFAIKNKSSLEDEAEILQQLKRSRAQLHPNVIRLYEYVTKCEYTTQNGEKYETVLIIMEYAQHGQLFDILRYAGALPNQIAKFYFGQIISALKAFHAQNIVHRDLKPENILLDSNFNIKICDFGLSTEIDIENDESMKGTAGTRGYMAPEILEKKEYDAKCDIFSAGVILFILLTARPPFSQASKKDKKYSLIMDEKYEQFWNIHCNKDIHKYKFIVNDQNSKDLMQKMICYDPTKRISLESIEAHPWMTNSESIDSSRFTSIMNQMYQTAIENKNKEERDKDKSKQKRKANNEDKFEFKLSTSGTQIFGPTTHNSTIPALSRIDETKEATSTPDPDKNISVAANIVDKTDEKMESQASSQLSQLPSSQLTAKTSSTIQLSYTRN